MIVVVWCDFTVLCFQQALGCVLYLLCFNEHPFADSAKLRIINANYTIPETDTEYNVFHDLISKSFTHHWPMISGCCYAHMVSCFRMNFFIFVQNKTCMLFVSTYLRLPPHSLVMVYIFDVAPCLTTSVYPRHVAPCLTTSVYPRHGLQIQVQL